MYINKRLVKFKILQKESCVSLRFFLLIILVIVIINNCRRDFRSCNVGCKRNIMNIAKTEQIIIVRFMRLCGKRISEEYEQVDFVAGNTACYLLTAALRAT